MEQGICNLTRIRRLAKSVTNTVTSFIWFIGTTGQIKQLLQIEIVCEIVLNKSNRTVTGMVNSRTLLHTPLGIYLPGTFLVFPFVEC